MISIFLIKNSVILIKSSIHYGTLYLLNGNSLPWESIASVGSNDWKNSPFQNSWSCMGWLLWIFMSHFEQTKKQGPQSIHRTHCWRSELHIEHFTDGGKASLDKASLNKVSLKPSQFVSRRVYLVCQVILFSLASCLTISSAILKASDKRFSIIKEKQLLSL